MPEDRKTSRSLKSFWDWAELLSKFMPAIVVAIIAFMGNQFLQNKQKADSNLKLYTQLLANKENSENTLRKDMFAKMLESFLSRESVESEDSSEKTLMGIRKDLLSLELLARNFHESLDMKPLFKHVLMKIIRPRIELKRQIRKFEKMRENKAFHDGSPGLTGNLTKNNENASQMVEAHEKKMKRYLSRYDRELDRLISIAKRISRKQREVLEDVAGKISLTIPLKGYASKDVCTRVQPNDISLVTPGYCPSSDEIDTGYQGYPVAGVRMEKILSFRNSNHEADDKSKRYFMVTVRYVYPRWKQVFVEIETSPDRGKHEAWKHFLDLRQQCEEQLLNRFENEDCLTAMYQELHDRYKPEIDADQLMNMSIDDTNRFLKQQFTIETAGFWLEYFDFPLVDNSYINSEQRYSVILEGFKPDREGEDEKAMITLLYYPAAYAGLKEKAFYNNKLMNNLMKQDFFKETKTSANGPFFIP